MNSKDILKYISNHKKLQLLGQEDDLDYIKNNWPRDIFELISDKCKLEDIMCVVKYSDGENDGDAWIALVALRNNKFGFISASCCYTGFDAMGGAYIDISDDLDYLLRFEIGDDFRERLGIEIG